MVIEVTKPVLVFGSNLAGRHGAGAAPGAHEVAGIQPLNIFSGEGGLGSILTNPTELARMKELLPRQYAVRYRGRLWPDAEAAYQHLKCGDAACDDNVMVEIVAAKLLQHPEVLAEVVARGGEAFLRQCSHLTGAKSVGAKAWEGKGMASRFIRNLVGGFVLAQAGAPRHVLAGTDPLAQLDLF